MPGGPETQGFDSGLTEFAALTGPATLTNGNYLAVVSPAGTGFSALGKQLLTTLNGDGVEDQDGFFIYIRDLESREFWSAGRRPVLTTESCAARIGPGRIDITRTSHEIETVVEICVDPANDVELRRVRVTNSSARVRKLEITSFAAVVLTDRGAWLAHPAFCRLFVQTAFNAATGALLAWRRPRSPEEVHPWLAHATVGPSFTATVGPASSAIVGAAPPAARRAGAAPGPGAAADPSRPEFETDRVRFIGRGNSLGNPAALSTTAPLSGTVGNVLDPIVSLRRTLELQGGAATCVTYLLAAASDRGQALSLVRRISSPAAVDAAFERAAGWKVNGDG